MKINNIDYEFLVEMARINDRQLFPYDVFVNGGNSYGSDRNEHGEPHFHFADHMKDGEFKFSILIPTIEEWKQNKELYICESSNKNFNWFNMRKEKRELIKWLDEQSKDTFRSNIELIRFQWNILNTDNKNVRQLKLK